MHIVRFSLYAETHSPQIGFASPGFERVGSEHITDKKPPNQADFPFSQYAFTKNMRCLSGSTRSLKDLYGILLWHCREGKWCISRKQLADELETNVCWVSLLLSRLRKWKLIDWRRRGPWKSEYWILPLPDPVWLQMQIRSCGPIRKAKTKDLTPKDVAEKQRQDVAEKQHLLMLSGFVSNGPVGQEKVTNRSPFPSPTPPQFPAVRHEHTNGRKNGHKKREPVPVSPNQLGGCQFCGARRINERYCVCDQAIAAYERRQHTNHERQELA